MPAGTGTATNAVRAKQALITQVRTLLAANPTTDQVTVTYGYDARRDDRELVHCGKAEGPQNYAVSGGGRARYSRDENLTVKLHIWVRLPGATQEEAEARCVEIGTVIEEAVAAKATIPNVPGPIWSGITYVDLDGDVDDEGGVGFLLYDVAVNTRLT